MNGRELCVCRSGRPRDVCPCGRRHFTDPSIQTLRKMAEWGNQQARQARERTRKYGKVLPIVGGVEAPGTSKKLAAVGNRIYLVERNATVASFLRDSLREVMGQSWWAAEEAKRPVDRHPIARWDDRIVTLISSGERNTAGQIAVDVDALVLAHAVLSYDLWVLRNYAKLQDRVVARLKSLEHFQGARYELFVAATCIRAGITIEMEDENDEKSKHPEFVGTLNGIEFDVEAKAKNRLAGYVPGKPIRLTTRVLEAACKKRERPLVLFQEVNVPAGNEDEPSWAGEAQKSLDVAREKHGTEPFALAFFTNLPHQYGEPEQPSPPNEYMGFVFDESMRPAGVAIREALFQYGNVPGEFGE